MFVVNSDLDLHKWFSYSRPQYRESIGASFLRCPSQLTRPLQKAKKTWKGDEQECCDSEKATQTKTYSTEEQQIEHKQKSATSLQRQCAERITFSKDTKLPYHRETAQPM